MPYSLKKKKNWVIFTNITSALRACSWVWSLLWKLVQCVVCLYLLVFSLFAVCLLFIYATHELDQRFSSFTSYVLVYLSCAQLGVVKGSLWLRLSIITGDSTFPVLFLMSLNIMNSTHLLHFCSTGKGTSTHFQDLWFVLRQPRGTQFCSTTVLWSGCWVQDGLCLRVAWTCLLDQK